MKTVKLSELWGIRHLREYIEYEGIFMATLGILGAAVLVIVVIAVFVSTPELLAAVIVMLCIAGLLVGLLNFIEYFL